MTGGVYLFGALFYLFFASGDIEDWAKNPAEIEKHYKSKYRKTGDKSSVYVIY